MSGELVSTVGGDAPLCPNSLPPVTEPHYLHNQVLDAFYNAAAKDDDHEFVSRDVDTAYGAAREINRMWLYVESTGVMHVGTFLVIESWYWRCNLCGCVLPATARPRTVQ